MYTDIEKYMKNASAKRYSRGEIFFTFVIGLVFLFCFICMLWCRTLVIRAAEPLLYASLAGASIYRARRKLKSGRDGEKRIAWYKQHNVALACAWFSGLAFFLLEDFVSERVAAVWQNVLIGLFFALMIAFLIYAFILFRQERAGRIRNNRDSA